MSVSPGIAGAGGRGPAVAAGHVSFTAGTSIGDIAGDGADAGCGHGGGGFALMPAGAAVASAPAAHP